MSILRNPKNAGRPNKFKLYKTKFIKIGIPKFPKNEIEKEKIIINKMNLVIESYR